MRRAIASTETFSLASCSCPGDNYDLNSEDTSPIVPPDLSSSSVSAHDLQTVLTAWQTSVGDSLQGWATSRLRNVRIVLLPNPGDSRGVIASSRRDFMAIFNERKDLVKLRIK